MTGETAVFMNHLSPAIRTGTHHFIIFFPFSLGIITNHPADGVGAGKDLVAVSPGGGRAPDTGDLLKIEGKLIPDRKAKEINRPVASI